MDFIKLLKNHYGNRKKGPSDFKLPKEIEDRISSTALPYLKKDAADAQVDPHLFEFFVYQKMYRRLDNGLLCCNDSVTYCDIDHDLVSEDVVDNVEQIADEFGYQKIAVYCNDRLDDALQELDRAWTRTTSRINRGENLAFKIKETKSGEQDWSLGYDSSEKLDDNFFRTVPQVEIPDIMMHMGDRTNMWCTFTHMKTRYNSKTKPAKTAINACVLSNAFGISTEKMAEISDMNFNLLRSTQEDYIRIDTICAANDRAGNLVHSLSIFKLWDLIDNKTLSDGDGQKLPTSESTIQSRYSTKYLGKAPGISVYTLIANFIAVNAKNIGLNEYEGHSLYDLINGNKTDINIDMVTGDNHSLNQLNFVILDSIDVDYVPSIKDIKEAAKDLFSVNSIDNYTGIIRPKGIINVPLIRSHKRGILRVLLSLLLQENTQSTIVKKINSCARYTGLKKGLFEYNKLLKSIHVLNLIDNMTLRKAIRTARNRTEAYHQLQGLIRKIYHGVFKGKKIVNNRVSAHAVRLVANSIIAHNSIILNMIYEQMLAEGVTQEIIDKFARISPIAWAHIAFTGKYNFKKSNGEIDINGMVSAVAKHLKEHFWKAA
jgi:TnpA family transposase